MSKKASLRASASILIGLTIAALAQQASAAPRARKARAGMAGLVDRKAEWLISPVRVKTSWMAIRSLRGFFVEQVAKRDRAAFWLFLEGGDGAVMRYQRGWSNVRVVALKWVEADGQIAVAVNGEDDPWGVQQRIAVARGAGSPTTHRELKLSREGAKPIILRSPPAAESRLQGTYCHQSGSSSITSGTSLSKTSSLRFDDDGDVTYRSHASFNSNLGVAGSTRNDSGWTQVIPGRSRSVVLVVLKKEGMMSIEVPTGKGAVSAFTVNGDRYSKSLCRF